MRPRGKAFMAEFKFSCPLCQQHILCDVDYSGSQINCPSCQKEIVVPQPPQVVDAPMAPCRACHLRRHHLRAASRRANSTPVPAQPSAGAPRLVDEPPPKPSSRIVLKIALCSLAAILILGLAAGGYWWMSRPQVITLPGGDKLTLIGVTYGKHHVAPKIKINGKLTRGNGSAV